MSKVESKMSKIEVREKLQNLPAAEPFVRPNSDFRNNGNSPSKSLDVEVQEPTTGSSLCRSSRHKRPVLKMNP